MKPNPFLQKDLSLSAKDRLIFPLDYPTWYQAEDAISALKNHVGIFKIGLELFVAEGPGIVTSVERKSGCGIFLDLKFHDIPETVRSAVRRAGSYGVTFVTVHASGGRAVLEAAVEGARGKVDVLAVTVLTSMGTDDSDILQKVLQGARLARETGCAGVVCSGVEVREVKQQIGADLIAVVPGVRPEWGQVSNDDQQRVATPHEAILNGADYLVVGRPIRKASRPEEAAEKVLGEIRSALDGLGKTS